MTTDEVREKYLKFFEDRGHKRIHPSPLVPENDPTTLFVSSGMQPLVPYLLGEKHPEGKRLVNSQTCIRLQDIEEVGDNRHTTFFEMLGNWSLRGDYFKKKQIPWVWEFLTDSKQLGLSKDRLWVSVFEGNNEVPRDDESVGLWKKLGIPDERIGYYGASKNWWSRSGQPDNMPPGEIGGPDSEVFFDFGKKLKIHEKSSFKNEECHMNCDCGRFLEIGNSVFIQYVKAKDRSLTELPNKNVDFGGGLERLVAVKINSPDIFCVDVLKSIIDAIEKTSTIKYSSNKKHMRIVADHLRAAIFLVHQGIVPSNKLQGYVARRLIRKAVYSLQYELGAPVHKTIGAICSAVVNSYENSLLKETQFSDLQVVIGGEVEKFLETLARGMKKIGARNDIDEDTAFDMYQTYGFPFELTQEIAFEKGIVLDNAKIKEKVEEHKRKSKKAATGMFKGGLADKSDETIKLHTATHLLHWALRKTLGDQVVQRGSNITAERLRFDFNHKEKLGDEDIKSIENLINEKIKEDLPVSFKMMTKEVAEKTGAIHAFGEKYGEKVKVYYIGKNFDRAISKEFCGGPHVKSTGEISHVKITKQKKIGAGLVRIYAENDGLI